MVLQPRHYLAVFVLSTTLLVAFLVSRADDGWYLGNRYAGTNVYEGEAKRTTSYSKQTDAGTTQGHGEETNRRNHIGNTNVTFEKCDLQKRRFMPEGSMPIIILLSYPGSGNTWVRYLLERASGIYSGSSYHSDAGTGDTDDAMFRRSDPCSGTTVAVKGHKYEALVARGCIPDGAVLLIRNPYNAMLAEFNRQKAGKTGFAPEEAFEGAEWGQFVRKQCQRWKATYTGHFDALSNRLPVFYEDLVRDTQRELRRMLDFLHVPLNETRLRCLSQDMDGAYKREHKHRIRPSPFTEEINVTVDHTIREMRGIVETYGITLPAYGSTN